MYEIPTKYALMMATTLVSGAASIIDNDTLIPLGVFCAFASGLVMAAWRVAQVVTRATDKLENIERRLNQVERRLDQ